MSNADGPGREEDLADLLADLEATLTRLRTELRTDGRDVTARSDRRDDAMDRTPASGDDQDRSERPQPPLGSDLLRFTEQYTLPTLISTLEATIQALELLRGAIRLVDGRSPLDGTDRGRRPSSRLGDGVAGVGREAVSGLERALSELEAALPEAEQSETREGDDLLAEIRALSAEISDRLEDGTGETRRRDSSQQNRGRPERGQDAGGVTIEVTSVDGESTADDTDSGPAAEPTESPPAVDVEAELESIRHEVRGTSENEADEVGSGSDPDGEGHSGSDGDVNDATRSGDSVGDDARDSDTHSGSPKGGD